jgi:ACT domain-containing protein
MIAKGINDTIKITHSITGSIVTKLKNMLNIIDGRSVATMSISSKISNFYFIIFLTD